MSAPSPAPAPAPAPHVRGEGDPREAPHWTRTYDKWNDWQDPEEVAKKREEEEKRAKSYRDNHMACAHDRSAERKVMEMPIEDKILACRDFRRRGNLFHKEGQYRRGALQYRQALIYYDFCFPDEDSQQQELDDIRHACLLNSAACFLACGELGQTLDCCYQPVNLRLLRERLHRQGYGCTSQEPDGRAGWQSRMAEPDGKDSASETSHSMASSEEDLGWSAQADDREDDDGFGEEEEDETSRRAVGPRLSTEARQQGFPAEGMFSGAHGLPAYDSSAGQPDDDVPEQHQRGGEGGSGGEREDDGRTGGAGHNNDRSFLTQQPAEDDDWSSGSGSDLGRLSGGGDGRPPAPSSSATSAAAAAAAAVALAEEEAEEANEQEERGGQVGVDVTGAPPPSSSNGRGWDSTAAAAGAAGGGLSEEGGSRFSHPGRGSTVGAGGVVGSATRGGRADLMSFRNGGGVGGDDSEDDDADDGSPLIAPSDIMSQIPATVIGRDREAQAVIDALQEVYRKSLKPIEELSLFEEFHYEVLTDADLQAKPQVLLLGQYSTGKTSMIRHFIGRDFPGMHIGPEASPDIFQVVTAGSAERTVKGSALCILDELPYTGLGKFGAPFLGKFQASIVPSPLLEHMNFVDTPGIVAADRHSAPRGYPFPEVVKWFADRSDLILLVFDAHKLDMGAEFREVVTAIAQHGDRVRVVLNKAQEVDNDRLLKVYGALMWSISRCLGGKASAPKVYVGSFWDGPRRHPDDRPGDDDDSFDLDEAALLREMMELPQNVGVRKINDLMQRAKLVKVHLQIVYAIRARMPRIWGAEAAQDRILASLEEVFEEVKAEGNVNDADMPDVEEYRRDLRRIDFRDLPRRNRRLLATLDNIVERDIKQCVTRAGGVRRFYKLDFAARIMDDFVPSMSRSRRRATTGGSGRDLDRSGSGVGDAFPRRLSMMRADGMTESSGGSEGDDEDSLTGSMGAMGRVEEEERVPFVLGSCVMVLVVLVGVCVAMWKMEALPATMDWAMVLKPGPFPSPKGAP